MIYPYSVGWLCVAPQSVSLEKKHANGMHEHPCFNWYYLKRQQPVLFGRLVTASCVMSTCIRRSSSARPTQDSRQELGERTLTTIARTVHLVTRLHRSSSVAVLIPLRSLRSLRSISTASNQTRYLLPNQIFHNTWYRELGHSTCIQK